MFEWIVFLLSVAVAVLTVSGPLIVFHRRHRITKLGVTHSCLSCLLGLAFLVCNWYLSCAKDAKIDAQAQALEEIHDQGARTHDRLESVVHSLGEIVSTADDTSARLDTHLTMIHLREMRYAQEEHAQANVKRLAGIVDGPLRITEVELQTLLDNIRSGAGQLSAVQTVLTRRIDYVISQSVFDRQTNESLQYITALGGESAIAPYSQSVAHVHVLLKQIRRDIAVAQTASQLEHHTVRFMQAIASLRGVCQALVVHSEMFIHSRRIEETAVRLGLSDTQRPPDPLDWTRRDPATEATPVVKRR